MHLCYAKWTPTTQHNVNLSYGPRLQLLTIAMICAQEAMPRLKPIVNGLLLLSDSGAFSHGRLHTYESELWNDLSPTSAMGPTRVDS